MNNQSMTIHDNGDDVVVSQTDITILLGQINDYDVTSYERNILSAILKYFRRFIIGHPKCPHIGDDNDEI